MPIEVLRLIRLFWNFMTRSSSDHRLDFDPEIEKKKLLATSRGTKISEKSHNSYRTNDKFA